MDCYGTEAHLQDQKIASKEKVCIFLFYFVFCIINGWYKWTHFSSHHYPLTLTAAIACETQGSAEPLVIFFHKGVINNLTVNNQFMWEILSFRGGILYVRQTLTCPCSQTLLKIVSPVIDFELFILAARQVTQYLKEMRISGG